MAQAETQAIIVGDAAGCCVAYLSPAPYGYEQARCITIDIGSGEIEDDSGITIITPTAPSRPSHGPGTGYEAPRPRSDRPRSDIPGSDRPGSDPSSPRPTQPGPDIRRIPQPTTQIIPVTPTERRPDRILPPLSPKYPAPITWPTVGRKPQDQRPN